MKMLRVFLAAILVALPLMAQQVSVTTVTPNTLQDSQIASFDADGTRTFDVRNGATRHQLTFRSSGTISAPTTVTVSCKVDTNNNYSQVGTSALLNDTIIWYGTVSGCRVVVTGFTGSGSIDAWYFGDTRTSQSVGLTGAPFNTEIGAVGDALKVIIAEATPGVVGSNVNVAEINGVTPLMGNGVTGTGSPRVTIASDNTAFSVNIGGVAVTAAGATDDVSITTTRIPTNAAMAGYDGSTLDIIRTATPFSAAGAAVTGALSAAPVVQYNTTKPTLTTGQVTITQATSDGIIETAPTPTIDGGVALSAAFTSTLGATVFNIKTSQGNLYGYQAFNAHTAVCFIQIFTVPAASVNLGTTTPSLAIGIPTVDEAEKQSTIPILYSASGLSAASTTTATGSTTCTAATVANFMYK